MPTGCWFSHSPHTHTQSLMINLLFLKSKNYSKTKMMMMMKKWKMERIFFCSLKKWKKKYFLFWCYNDRLSSSTRQTKIMMFWRWRKRKRFLKIGGNDNSSSLCELFVHLNGIELKFHFHISLFISHHLVCFFTLYDDHHQSTTCCCCF